MTSNRSNEKTKTKRVRKLCIQEKILNQSPNNEFMINEVVLCTIPGYAPWAARIREINNQTIFVEFFGTSQMYVNAFINLYCCSIHCVCFFRNPVRIGAVSRFDVTKAKQLLERKGYKKAIRELEMALKVPLDVSFIVPMTLFSKDEI